jgi:hypothetical protein
MNYLQKFIRNNDITLNYDLNEKNLPQFIFEQSLNKATYPNVRHLKLCGCFNHLFEDAKNQAISNAKCLYDERKLSERDQDGKIWNLYHDTAIKEDSWKLLEKSLKVSNNRCPIELRSIFEFLVLYASKYDLADADVWNIVEPLLNFKLTVDRYALYSNHNDFVRDMVDKNGNSFITISPVEDLKLKFDIARTNAVEKLNRMIEGSKSVNVNISASDNIMNVWERRKGNKE